MSLGQNEQFFYAPDVKIYINSLAEGGIIDISDDFMSLTIQRNINAVSTASVYLANNGFKYTPASFNFTGSDVPPPVINTMDQIIIFLKKEGYYQYFTGFVTYAPIVTLIPEPILINCSCTLYKAQNSYWDAGAIEYEGIIPGILQNAQVFGGKVQNNDGGVATGITRLLTKVANWNPKDIHIGGIPAQWVSFATDIYKQTQIQLADKNATSFKDIINFLEVTGNSAKSVTTTTTQGKTGIDNGTVNSLGVHGAPEGTAIKGITGFDTVTATFATTSEMQGYTLTGPGGRKGTPEVDIIVNNDNNTQYWVALPFTYFASNVGDPTTAKEWLKGASAPFPYPSSAQRGRLVLITNNVNGQQKQVQAHAVYAIKDNLQLNGADIILSEAAFISLGGSTSPSTNILNNISVNGWVNPNATNLKGGTIAKTIVNKNTTISGTSTVDGSYPTWQYNLLNPKTLVSNLGDSAQPSAKARNSNYAQWEYDLLRALGGDPNQLPASLEALARIANFEGGAFHYNWLNVSAPPQYPLVGMTGVLSNNPDYIAVFPNESAGVAGTAEFFRNSTYSRAFLKELLNPSATISSIAASMQGSSWGQGDINAVLNGNSAPNDYTNQAVPGLSNVGGNYNFSTTQGVVGFDTNSTILAGTPRAFITDVPALSTITTLSTMGLREFQSGPDGSFLSWYPDYFGLYGTAPALSIYDIEIIDFSIYHDDTQLYTHIGVSGDPTEIGNVSLVDWLMTNGIVTIENNAILGLLFGTNPSTINSSMNSLLAQKINPTTFAKQFLKRYGMRPYVDSEPMIRSELMEFMYALQEFIYLWSQQYATNVTFTFMPELYPGMIIEIVEHGIQVYVQSVVQSCSRDGGFTTNAVVTCPTRVIGKKNVNGRIVNNVVPLDFGYPIKNGTI